MVPDHNPLRNLTRVPAHTDDENNTFSLSVRQVSVIKLHMCI